MKDSIATIDYIAPGPIKEPDFSPDSLPSGSKAIFPWISFNDK